MIRMLPEYIYRNLAKYGNCSLGMSNLKRFGNKAILDDLKKNGFECELCLYDEESRQIVSFIDTKQKQKIFVIAKVVRKEKK